MRSGILSPPSPTAACCKHHPTGMKHVRALRGGRCDFQEPTGGHDAGDLDLMLHRQAQNALQPAQVIDPEGVLDLVERLPGVGSEGSLVPGTKAQRRDAERWTRQRLRRSQSVHACEGEPGPFIARRRAFENAHVAHALEDERGGRGNPVHAGSHDQHVGHGFAVRRQDVRGPVGSR